MSSRDVPFVDLRAQHDEIRSELTTAFNETLDTSAFVGGAAVSTFEERFAAYVGVGHAVGVANGTDAVGFALRAAGARPGDAIVTVSHTFIGTTEAASQMNVLPLFVDVDEESATMDPVALGRFLDERCRRDAAGVLRHTGTGRRVAAIVPVHLYGQSADMAPILELGRMFGVPVVEDAAQAQGARYRFPDGREVACGAMGVAGSFSFYPGKNLGAIGEAGAVVTSDPEAAERMRLYRDHGQAEKYVHQIADGGNYRLDALQARVLTIKLARLERWNDARRAIARLYDRALAGAIRTPVEKPNARHIYHLYVVQSQERDRLRQQLAEDGIGTGLHYPIPLHLQPAFAGTESAADVSLPVTEYLAATCLSLPMYPHLGQDAAGRVTDAVLERASVSSPEG